MTVEGSSLGSLLRQHRRAAALTQEQLAERAGISARTVSDVERGIRSTIYRDTAGRLADALGLAREERIEFESVARGRAARRGPEEAWTSTEEDIFTTSVPLPPTRLIGRKHELEVVLAALRDPHVRLLTLTGPGGIGKTRLAAEAAGRAHTDFRDGVFFVSLAGNRHPDLVGPILARTLGVTLTEEALVTAIAAHQRGKRSLLVLDTFERLLAAVPLLGNILAACPGLTMLVTSRAALRLRGEHEVALPTLELPSEDPGGADHEDTGASPATTLFVERARAVRPDLVIDQDATREVAEICRRVNGLPLAIELAAARVKHLPLPALRDHLEDRLSVLTGGARDLPRRQRTMRDTVGWSYELLESVDRRLFRRLGVFAGGCTLEAARSVSAPDAPAVVLEGISALVDSSLVFLVNETDVGPRYQMLDVINEFAIEQADVHEETEPARERHAAFFLAMAEEAEPELGLSAQEAWYLRLQADQENLRSALRWSIQRKDAHTALRLGGAVWQFWRAQGEFAEGRLWLREALAIAPTGTPAERAKALWGAAWLAYHQGDYPDASRLGGELLLLSQDGEPIDRRNALTVGGMVAMAEGRLEDAASQLAEALAIARQLGPGWILATSLLNLGVARLHTGDAVESKALLHEAHALYSEIGDEHFRARALGQLAYVALVNADPETARALFDRALQTFQALGDRWGVAESLEGLSAVSAATGQDSRAARIAGAAGALWEAFAMRPLPSDRVIAGRFQTAAREGLGERAWAARWAEGHALPLGQAIDLALGRG